LPSPPTSYNNTTQAHITDVGRTLCADVVGLLFIKDLLVLHSDDSVPLSKLIDTSGDKNDGLVRTPPVWCAMDTKLDSVLVKFFQTNTHMMMLYDPASDSKGEPRVACGIITLEDLTEFVFGSQIRDDDETKPENAAAGDKDGPAGGLAGDSDRHALAPGGASDVTEDGAVDVEVGGEAVVPLDRRLSNKGKPALQREKSFVKIGNRGNVYGQAKLGYRERVKRRKMLTQILHGDVAGVGDPTRQRVQSFIDHSDSGSRNASDEGPSTSV
jgi:hypothetical protein